MPPAPAALDLFSGTGGIAYALRGGLAAPVAYCEIDPDATRILQANMARGHIPRAPVHPDVCALDPAPLPPIELVTAGFPCTGFSVAGRHDGFANPASGLFHRVVELAERLRPPLLFLENTPDIVNRGLDVLVAELHGRLGYALRWVVIPAYLVGAPQTRMRWYCLAVRPGYARAFTLAPTPPFDWTGPAPARMVPVGSSESRAVTKRMRALGNGIVPDAVRLAFLFLVSGGRVRALDAHDVTVHLQPMDASLSPVPSRMCPRCGCVDGSSRYGFNYPAPVPPPDFGLRLTPAGSAPATNPSISTKVIEGDLPLRMWSTPRFKNRGANKTLTFRGAQDLGTQMKFEAGTPVAHRGAGFVASVTFVEWLMGFPRDFTLF